MCLTVSQLSNSTKFSPFKNRPIDQCLTKAEVPIHLDQVACLIIVELCPPIGEEVTIHLGQVECLTMRVLKTYWKLLNT